MWSDEFLDFETWVIHVRGFLWCIVIHEFDVCCGCAMWVKGPKVNHCICFCGDTLMVVKGDAFCEGSNIIMIKMSIVDASHGNTSNRIGECMVF